MRLAIISDIHGNLPALDAVLASTRREGCDGLFCLGDVVGYGARPNECIERLVSQGIPCILGNHDAAAIGRLNLEHMNNNARVAIEWTASVLTEGSMSFLRALALTHSSEEALFVHSSPYQPEEWNYVFNVNEARLAFKAFQEPVCFIGHSHFPVIFTAPDDGRRLINVGSVGQPRDRDARACYGIFDVASRGFRWVRVDYPISESAQQIVAAGLPRFLAERLSAGI